MKTRFLAAALLLALAGPAGAQTGTAISNLPAATTPLSGTEKVPMVQNGQTVQGPSSAFGVQGPASAVSGDLPSFNGASGRSLSDSGVLAAHVVSGPNSSTSGHIPTFNGTGGNVLQDSGSAITKTTPTVSLAFGGLSVGVTYATQIGTCTNIADVQSCNIDIHLSSKGSSSGQATITGLPTSANTGGANACAFMGSSFASSLTTQGLAYIANNTGTITLSKLAAGSTSNLADTDFTNTTEVIVTCVYHD